MIIFPELGEKIKRLVFNEPAFLLKHFISILTTV
jgi:hypothetical protein